MNGFNEYKKYVKVNIISSIVGLVFTIVLIYFANLRGALISAVTYQSIIFFVSLYFVSKCKWFKKEYLFGKFKSHVALNLMHFSLMTIVSALIVPFSQIYIRNHIAKTISFDAAGIWEGINRMSGIYLMIITSSLAIYYLPKISSLKKISEIRLEILNVYKFLTPIVLIAVTLIFLFKYYIILIVFTKDFLEMQYLFSYQLVGDFFKMMSWVLSFIMIAKAQTKLFVFSELFFASTFVLLVILCISEFELIGVSIAHMINYILYFIFLVIVYRNLLFLKSSKSSELF